MSFDNDTHGDDAVIAQLRDRWLALETTLRATLDQLDCHLAEFSRLSERTFWLFRRTMPASTAAETDASFEGWATLIGLDKVDTMLCEAAERVQNV